MPAHRILIVSSLAATLLSACVVAPYYPPRQTVYAQPVPAYPQSQPVPAYGAEGDTGVIVDVPPPAPYVEVVPPVPFAGAIWIGGYWGWSGGRHHWVGGHWDHPRPGYTYHPHAWVQQGGRWHLRGGGWVRG